MIKYNDIDLTLSLVAVHKTKQKVIEKNNSKCFLQAMASQSDSGSPRKDTQETSAASLSEKAQQIVNGFNGKRKQDTEMLAELKTTLLAQVMIFILITTS